MLHEVKNLADILFVFLFLQEVIWSYMKNPSYKVVRRYKLNAHDFLHTDHTVGRLSSEPMRSQRSQRGQLVVADLQESRRGCWHVVTPKKNLSKSHQVRKMRHDDDAATQRRRSDTTTTPSLDQVRNLFVVWRSIDRSGPGQAARMAP